MRVVSVANVFKRRLKQKTDEQRRQVRAAIQQMEQNLNHPGLRVRPIESKTGVWEARASESLRLSFSFEGPQEIRLRANCTHNQVYGPLG